MYARKHPVPPGSAPETVLFVDMGRLQSTVVVARFGRGAEGVDSETKGEGQEKEEGKSVGKCPYAVLAARGDGDLGAFHFDQRMFRHFRGAVSILFFTFLFLLVGFRGSRVRGCECVVACVRVVFS